MRSRWCLILVVQILSVRLGVSAVGGAPAVDERKAVRDRASDIVETRHESLTARELVTVRVYGAEDLSAATRQAALDVAEGTFQAASLDVAWTVCPDGCDHPPSHDELLVRLVRAPAGLHQDVLCLGDALIDAQKRTGVLATVYVNRVSQLARELGVEEGVLMGRTLAHEIGHLLLASNQHGTGLMRQVWSREELRRGRPDDWLLQSLDAAAIRRRLAESRHGHPRSTS